ncbi:MAG: hypothetical protein A3K06_02240 [Candidatus Doudnabacteria bacterium RIFCSPHIGHO2_01_52_17]|uniref:DUF456 domain-containing protein n=1 Tax=Candidatus Doudnabacteria bacterium RIFCSPHIGHO2_01_52_17 TaxID=1817820 RepID=A0A1F5NA31_9BACT|nr:MAG: hypothetical protein A3K06_02240 [Candidatus Doudnabacteria bacterium RIFCSPHIGHO2_01_52_17]
MDYSIFWNILAGILIFGGFLGALLPLLPGPPLAMAGLLIYAIAERFTSVSPWVVGALALLTLSTILVDVFAPVLAAKGYKASRLGVIGSFVGAIVGLWFGPLGIIVGPFVGAFVGEYFFNPDAARALRSAWGTFVGFVVGTVFKLVVTVAIAFYFVYALIR